MKPENEQKTASTFVDPTLISDDEARTDPPKTIADLLAMPGIEHTDLVFERSMELVKPAQFPD